jgi:adenylate cyclase
LLRQGLVADRNERRLAERTRTVARQYAAYAALASEATLFDPGERPPDVLTETLADMTDARRASLWRLADDGQSLRCEDSFERENRGHVAGLELHRDEMPAFFEAVASGEELEVADAATDRRTGQLHRALMAAHGSRSLFLVPLRRYGTTTGAIWLEDSAPTDAARDFVRLTANMMAFRTSGPLAPAGTTRQVADDQGGYVTEEVHHSADIARPSGDLDGVDPASLAADVYADVAVMVLHLPDAVSLATQSREQASLADALACALQIVAADHALPYLKFLGQEVVAACGFGTADPGGLMRLADAAVTIRDRCIELFEAADVHPDFRIGLDCGVAIGAEVGLGPRVFNLWGEAVRAADAMAASALPAAIQVTGTAYARLRQDYLFRPRGRFYMAGVGQAQTFVLSGRL